MNQDKKNEFSDNLQDTWETQPENDADYGSFDDEMSRPSHYVGIGASAGGLEALESFFQNMQANSGLAFIVIQHLSPHYKSLMVEILSKRTQMPVYRAEDNMQVEADSIYLIPPKMNLSIFHGKLLLKEQNPDKGINLPIDIFFRSLADDQGERSIGIILSGTGSDGMRGIRSIKDSGGVVMVQDEESAKFDGMPRSAISTGLADFILPPDKMPEQLLQYTSHPYVAKSHSPDKLITDEDTMTRIFALLREHTGVDFAFYKPSTINRRIERRMTINQVSNLSEYLERMERYPKEVLALHRELLIGVTSFFRDPDAFQKLKDDFFPDIFENAKDNQLRFWVSGCSTGEEAYSLAILCREFMEESGYKPDIKIFATDIDKNALERASSGIYTESIAADISPQRLNRFFNRAEDHYRISRSVREMVVFAPHNILRDPPFTRIDLITCRNLLIYLQPVMQKKALSLFSFSLKTGGVLMLGTSETVGDLTDLFELQDGKLKIYKARGGNRARISQRLHSSYSEDNSSLHAAGNASRNRYRQSRDDNKLLERLVDGLPDEIIPPGIVVNEEQEIVHVLGDVREYFTIQPGPLTMHVTKVARRDLAIPIATGVQKAFKGHSKVVYKNVKYSSDKGTNAVDLRIVALPERKNLENLVAIFLKKVEEKTPTDDPDRVETYDMNKEAQQRITDLEQELQYNKENLQATIEELETSNEELQATNEELLASNEELQSTNEELQSVNEELYTVNAEHQNKIVELTDLNNDMDNLLRSTEIGTIFLDEELAIRKYTPAVDEVMKIMEHDIGRPIQHLSHELVGADLIENIDRSLKRGAKIEQEVQNKAGKYFLMRVMPYRVEPDVVRGVVITFIDLTRIKRANQEGYEFQESLINNLPLPVYFLDTSGKCGGCNSAFAELLGRSKDDLIGSFVQDIWPDEICKKQIACNRKLIREPGRDSFEATLELDGNAEPRKVVFQKASFLDADGKVRGIIDTIIDKDHL